MDEIYLHIGLHKTATKFYQHNVFPFLDKENHIYNPPKLTQYLMDYLKAKKDEKDFIFKIFEEEKKDLLSLGKKILISREIMSGDLFSAYENWSCQMESLNKLFPEAKIIVSLRYQPDWLLSCYRESIHEHHYQRIEDFLCIDNNTFLKPKDFKKINPHGFVRLYSLNLDYEKMLKKLFSFYETKKVLVLFFEDFKMNKKEQLKNVLDFIGSTSIEIKSTSKIPNRGYSANSIRMSLHRFNSLIGTKNENQIHRPIHFFGPGSIPAGNIDLSILDKKKHWGNNFLRDNEEVRSANYPNISSEEKQNYLKSWRYKIKNVIDEVYYYDWDLLSEYREDLNSFYRQKNKNLVKILHKVKVPDLYLK